MRSIASNGIVVNASEDNSSWRSLSLSALGVIRDVYRKDWDLYEEAIVGNAIKDVTQIISLDKL